MSAQPPRATLPIDAADERIEHSAENQWRGELREWGESLLSEDRLKVDGLLNVAAVRKAWSKHQSGRGNWDSRLWTLLMLQEWLDGRPSRTYPT